MLGITETEATDEQYKMDRQKKINCGTKVTLLKKQMEKKWH